MAELNGTDTDEFLSNLYAKGKAEREAALGLSNIESKDKLPTVPSLTILNKDPENESEFALKPEGVVKEKTTEAPTHKVSKKTWSELDKYIELLLDSK